LRYNIILQQCRPFCSPSAILDMLNVHFVAKSKVNIVNIINRILKFLCLSVKMSLDLDMGFSSTSDKIGFIKY